MEFYTTMEMAKIWKISRRRVTTLCTEGRVEVLSIVLRRFFLVQ